MSRYFRRGPWERVTLVLIALGIAILGSVGTALYRAEVADTLPADVPAAAADAARDTLGGAIAIAESLPAAIGDAVAMAAQVAFVDALHLVAAVAAIGEFITAALYAAALRSVPARSEPDGGPATEPLAAD